MYKDRGLIKWAPFDALSGFREEINEMLYQKNKQEMPIIQEDKLIEMDYIIKEAIDKNIEIEVTYFHDGYFKVITSKIKKVCTIYKRITFTNSQNLYLKNIIDVNL